MSRPRKDSMKSWWLFFVFFVGRFHPWKMVVNHHEKCWFQPKLYGTTWHLCANTRFSRDSLGKIDACDPYWSIICRKKYDTIFFSTFKWNDQSNGPFSTWIQSHVTNDGSIWRISSTKNPVNPKMVISSHVFDEVSTWPKATWVNGEIPWSVYVRNIAISCFFFLDSWSLHGVAQWWVDL